jgi:hypothetical protein
VGGQFALDGFRTQLKNCDVTRWGQFTDIKDIKKRDVPAPRDSIPELAQLVNACVFETQDREPMELACKEDASGSLLFGRMKALA